MKREGMSELHAFLNGILTRRAASHGLICGHCARRLRLLRLVITGAEVRTPLIIEQFNVSRATAKRDMAWLREVTSR